MGISFARGMVSVTSRALTRPHALSRTLADVAALVAVAELASLPLASRGTRWGDTSELALFGGEVDLDGWVTAMGR